MPSTSPKERNSHPSIVHRRTARSHASSRYPVTSAAIPNAYGIVMATNPM